MRTCEKCRVDVYGSNLVCPLCQSELPGAPCPAEDIFPVPAVDAQAVRERRFTAALAAGSAGAVVVCVAVNAIVSAGYWWSLFVLGGVATFWLCWVLTESKKKTVFRNIVWETVVFSLLAVLWDIFTGFRGWSVSYVVPILLAFGIAVTSILSGAGIVKEGNGVFYRFLLSLLGLVPVILLLAKTVSLFIPSVICAALSALSLIHILGFEMTTLKPELRRRLHI